MRSLLNGTSLAPLAERVTTPHVLRAALAAGCTDNGVFAARIMWGTLHEVVDRLGTIYSDLAGDDLALLNRAFGRPGFVYLRRQDVVGQAVSLFRAEQTDVWHKTDRSDSQQQKQDRRYEFDGIRDMVRMINEHNAAWTQWFASAGLRPFSVLYEDLEADPVEVTRGVLDYLQLELPPDRTIIGHHERLRDELSAEWIVQFQNEIGAG
jgi:LPS sulfotransferase NodH